MYYRLVTISNELSDQLSHSTNEKQREVVAKSCDYAINKAKLDIPLLFDILKKYVNKQRIDENSKRELERLIICEEENYFGIQETEENDKGQTEEYLISFGKARALSTFLYCFETDLALASNEAVYEASVITDDNEEIIAIAKNVINNSND